MINGGPASRDFIEIEVRCPVETRVLSILRRFVSCLSLDIGFSHEEADKIEMAVDEACANVIRHAYKHLGISPDLPEEQRAKDHSILKECVLQMQIQLASDFIKISIIDKGIGIEKARPAVGSISEFANRGGKGGLGIYIIHNFMDEVEYYHPEKTGTILTMKKYLHQRT